MLKINAYTGGIYEPSARYRIRQLIPYLEKENIVVRDIISKAGTYPPGEIIKAPLWFMANFLDNMAGIVTAPPADIYFLQREMSFPYYTTERFLPHPLIFDVDDAIFLHKSGTYAKRIARNADRIICGNSYLASAFSDWNPQVDIIPTSVDVARYDRLDKAAANRLLILWTGSSSNFHYLYDIEKPLAALLEKHDTVRLKIVANIPPAFTCLKENQFIYEKWNPSIEYSSVKNADIGIMPIGDDDWSRGKCSFKMLCCMAAALPVVVSPYGMNEEILKAGDIGYGARTDDEWYAALEDLILSRSKALEMGRNGRELVKRKYDVNIVAKRLSFVFESILT
jgi:glycosyltransferase involved in cell wall biosynthesis